MQPPHEGLVHVLVPVGGKDDDALVFVHPLQEVADLDIGVPVMGVANLAAPAEKGVRFVEEQDGVAALGLGEDFGQVLLRLPDVFADHRRKIDLVDVQRQRAGDDVGSHRLAGPRGAGKQHVETFAQRQFPPEAPLLVDDGPVLDVVADLAQSLPLVDRQDDIVPTVVGADLLGQDRQFLIGMKPAGRVEVVDGDPGFLRIPPAGEVAGARRGVADLSTGEAELAGQFPRVQPCSFGPGSFGPGSFGKVAIQGLRPQPGAFGGIGASKLDPRERDLSQAARRFPGGFPGEERHSRTLRQPPQQRVAPSLLAFGENHIDSVPVERRPGEEGLARGQSDDRLELRLLGICQSVQVHGEQAQPQLPTQRLGGGLLADAIGALKQQNRRPFPGTRIVREPCQTVFGLDRQHQPVERGSRRGCSGVRHQADVEPVVVEQVVHHPFVELEITAQQRRTMLGRVVEQVNHPLVDERRAVGESLTRLELGFERRA